MECIKADAECNLDEINLEAGEEKDYWDLPS